MKSVGFIYGGYRNIKTNINQVSLIIMETGIQMEVVIIIYDLFSGRNEQKLPIISY